MMKTESPEPVRTETVVLDVGHGNATIVHEGDTTIVVDTALGPHILEYLQGANIDTIDLIVLSHADQDHIGGLVGILTAGIKVKVVKLNSDSQKETQTWRDLIFELDRRARDGEIQFDVGLTAGDLPVEGLQRYSMQVAMPTKALAALGVGAKDRFGQTIESNSISACIRILYETQPVLLIAGDMDSISLAEALHTGAALSAPLLIFPHHGGLPGSANPGTFTKDLLTSVKPNSVIFSIGRRKHQNPNSDVVQAIHAYDANIRIACTQLSKACAELVGESSAHLAPIYAAGVAGKTCCAGSIVIDPAPKIIALPSKERHSAFVENIATPLCRQHVRVLH